MTEHDFGVISSPAYDLPQSSYLSEEGARSYLSWLAPPSWMPAKDADIAEVRRWFDETTVAPRLARARELYPARIGAETIGGVSVKVVHPATPYGGKGILIAIHGGGFRVGGGGLAGELEALPLAAMSGFPVVAVDYRMAPEFAHPAAVEDLEAVYRQALERHRPEEIGLCGCSAGGVLASQLVVRLQQAGLPPAGAIALISSGAEATFGGGDSLFTSVAAKGAAPAPASPNPPVSYSPVHYLKDADLTDPRVSPVVDDAALTRFPPTLLLTATRDFALSAATYTHRRLLGAGAEANLVVWDGLGHGFTYDSDTPEAREAFQLLGRFFLKHLRVGG